MYEYRADDLEDDELNYELKLRGVTPSGSITQKRRYLRSLLSDDRKYGNIHYYPILLEIDSFEITEIIVEIENALKVQVTPKERSRLICLRNRVLRAPTNNKELKCTLERQIHVIQHKYDNINKY